MSPQAPDVRITDSTLRDGSHAMRHRFTEEQVRAVVYALDHAGVQVIEVSHGDGLGGSSFSYGFSGVDEISLIRAAVAEAVAAKIAVLLLPGVGTVDDLRDAREAGASVARIATHCTEADVSVQHFGAARELGMETVGFLMLSHRLDPAGLAKQGRIMVDAGAECVYLVDSAGALVLSDAQARVQALIAEIGSQAQVGFHGHQNAVRARGRRGERADRGAGGHVLPAGHIDRGRRERRARGRRGGGAADHPAAAVDGPRVGGPGLRRGVLLFSAARAARRRTLRRARARDLAAGR